MDFSANWAFHKQSEGTTRDGGSSAEPGLGFTAVYHIFLLLFPPRLGSSGFLFSHVKTGAEPGTVGWVLPSPACCTQGAPTRAGLGQAASRGS